jgi:hypothetical protein
MRRTLSALLGVAVLAATAATGSTTASTTTRFSGNADAQPGVSSNWSGYALEDQAGTGLQFTSVTGTWKQPKATCAKDSTAASAFWVGIGGESESATGLEQTGTSADCNADGTARYYAWYEILPAPAIQVPLKIRPGDQITTSVNVNGGTTLVQIKNRTRKTSFTKALAVAAPDLTSAEWIAEAPSSCDNAGRCVVLPLANFGKVNFTRAAAIASTHPGTISDATWANVAIKLVPDGLSNGFSRVATSTAGALPGTLSSDGRSFPVTWVSNATA